MERRYQNYGTVYILRIQFLANIAFKNITINTIMINNIMFKVYLVPLIGVCMYFSSYQEGTSFSIQLFKRRLGDVTYRAFTCDYNLYIN